MKKKGYSYWTHGYENKPQGLAPQIQASAAIGVTVSSPKYAHLTDEAVKRFRAMTGLDVVVIWSQQEPAFASKLNLDLLVAARPIVFFDVDLWMLRPFDFVPLAQSKFFSAVPDPGALNKDAFPHTDCEREGWEKANYFNSGLFCCDLSRPEIRDIFKTARRLLTACHDKQFAKPVDWTDQFFLNYAVQLHAGLYKLPFAMNFYKKAVDWGSFPHIPREIIGLHAAGVPIKDKLATLQREAAVFGEPSGKMLPEAADYYSR